jgi:D-alanine-D-alanine ligase
MSSYISKPEVSMRVLLLCGGRSAEREISLVSAAFVSESLSVAGHAVETVRIGVEGAWLHGVTPVSIDSGDCPWRLSTPAGRLEFDVVFPVLHGPFGEDGTVQGLCETAGWPCAGAGVMASSVAMDKITFKRLAAGSGIAVTPWIEASRDTGRTSSMVADLLVYPVFVKPSRLGSSVGISRVTAPQGLADALAAAFEYDDRVLVESAVPCAREIEVAVLGDSSGVASSLPGEIFPGKDWYDYEAKYDCPASAHRIPADLDPETAASIGRTAELAFSLLGGRGFARADFLVGPGGAFMNEINTIPGFTSISMFPKLWEASGLPAPALMDRILAEALDRRPAGLWKGA